MAYLALPNAIFLAGWLNPVFAWGGIVALAFTLAPILERSSDLPSGQARPIRALALLAVAVSWSALGGAGHLVYANSDWLVRDAVLRDLVVGEWPVVYGAPDDSWGDRVLRAPIAFYLPAAVAGKFLGLSFADPALLLWTSLGVWLLLLLVVDREDSASIASMKVLVIVLFSGMDVVGALLTGAPVSWTGHIEWWASIFQYSSHTTQLFWVPGHALPGWIAAAMIYRQWGSLRLTRSLPGLLALIPLWSPLTALGVLPLAAAALVARLRRFGLRGALPLHACLGAGVVVALVGGFLTADGDRIRSEWIWQAVPDGLWLVPQLTLFVLLEFLLLARLAGLAHRPRALVVSSGVLMLLPLYSFGPSNDLAMRASIPALMVLSLAFADASPVLLGGASSRPIRWATIVVFLLGCATPMTEIARALVTPRWASSATRTVVEATQGSHYLADRANPRLQALLRSGSSPIRSPAER